MKRKAAKDGEAAKDDSKAKETEKEFQEEYAGVKKEVESMVRRGSLVLFAFFLSLTADPASFYRRLPSRHTDRACSPFPRFASMSPSFPLRRASLVDTHSPAKECRALTRILYCNVVLVFPLPIALRAGRPLPVFRCCSVRASTALSSVPDAAVPLWTAEECRHTHLWRFRPHKERETRPSLRASPSYPCTGNLSEVMRSRRTGRQTKVHSQRSYVQYSTRAA